MGSRTQIEAHDLWVAFSLLSRLPVPVDHARAGDRMAAAVWAWPVVGAVIGAAMGCAGELALVIGLPQSVAAVCAITVGMLATGALHEDGLADCADGFGGGQTKERVLGIPVLLDGFIASSAALVLHKIDADLTAHLQAAHLSAEGAHEGLLTELDQTPLLSLGMRLGEGSGAAVALQIVKAAVACHAGMATFAEAGVSDG